MDIIEYKSRMYKEFDLPSGLHIKMKKLSPFKFLKEAEEKGVSISNLTENVGSFYTNLIVKLVVEPKLTDDETTENELSIYDIDPEDSAVLMNSVLEDVSTFSVESFRTK